MAFSTSKMKIGSFAKVQGGYAFKSKDLGDNGVPVIKITNVKEKRIDLNSLQYISKSKLQGLERFYIKNGDVLISMTGNGAHCNNALVGRTAIFTKGDDEYVLNQRVGRFIVDESKVLKEYLYYHISQPSINYYLATISTGSANQANINASTIENLEIDIPDMSVQKKVVNILSSLDKKIENNKEVNSTLEAIASKLFKSWFVDFDPVYAKQLMLDNGFSNKDAEDAAMAIISGICSPKEFLEKHQEMKDKFSFKCSHLSETELKELAKIASLFPSTTTSDKLGSYPKGWDRRPLSSMITFNPKLSLKKGTVSSYIDMKALPTNGHRVDKIIKREFKSGTKFQNGDVLMARITPCLENGKTAFIDCLENDEIAWGSTEFIVMRSDKEIPDHWVYLLSRSSKFVNFAVANMSGTSGRQRVPSSTLESYSFPFPPNELLNLFGKYTLPYFKRIKNNSIENTTLESIRDNLVPKLLNGDLDISKIEQITKT